ncbi:MAG: hypothetical protein INH41_02515 [Myxococcaceae bacterium]|jgi:3-oxoacyl-[acyl-carrier-protein] synthase III|nr:hypothetical protein [Myxococcaceae bacterium]
MHTHWKHVRLVGWAHEVPGREVTSAALEERLWPLLERAGVARGTLEAKTGVRARRWYEPCVDPEDVAARVACRAIEQARVPGREVGLVINASIDHRLFEPSGAHVVGQALGVGADAALFDVRNACLGFVDALTIAAERIEAGAVEVAVVVAAEAGGMRRAIDVAIDSALAQGELTPELWVPLTMGCGAVAWVLAAARRGAAHASLDACVTRNQTEHGALCVGRIEDSGRLTIRANGPGILRQGVPLIASTFAAARERGAALGQAFMHQVGSAHLAALEKLLGHRMHPRSATFRELGNTGPVGMPLAVALAADAGALSRGPVTLLGAGSGLSSAVLSLTWGVS